MYITHCTLKAQDEYEGTYELNKVQLNFKGYSTQQCDVSQQMGF
jgi:hypothetical protein